MTSNRFSIKSKKQSKQSFILKTLSWFISLLQFGILWGVKSKGEKEPDDKIYTSLPTLFDEEAGEVFPRLIDKTFGYAEMEVYGYCE